MGLAGLEIQERVPPFFGADVVAAHTRPVEECLQTLIADQRAVEIMIVTEIPRPSVECAVPNVFPSQGNAAESVSSDSSHAPLLGEFHGKACRIPRPCNGMRAVPLHAEGGNAHSAIGEVCEEPWVDVVGGEDVILQEEDPGGFAEGSKVCIDPRAGTGDLMGCHSAREVGESLESHGEGAVRVGSVRSMAEPCLYGGAERMILGSINDDEVRASMGIGLPFEECPCERPHPFSPGEGEAEGGIERLQGGSSLYLCGRSVTMLWR